ncbi:MAG: M23 family metallopeptidase, partial [Pseudomonadota bacterium]
TAGLSEGLLLKLVEIFGWDIDFAQQLRRGDGFAVIYEEKFSQGQKIADGQILAAEFVNQGKTYRAIGFRDDRGRLEYHTPEGLSLRRPFLRTPVELSRISSRFAMRFHPVLKTWRAHTGVDYAAPTGTPVRATATGRVTALGWNGGYGQAVTLKHGGAFSTLYGHLSRFHSGLRVGSPIEQGQVIGYVGATGLATGPHLHYELQVNGRHQNPITFKFPGATPLAPEHKQAFLRNAGQFGTRLDLISRHNQVASSK